MLPNYVPGIAERSLAGEGGYAVAFGRLSAEKGFEVAVEAARARRGAVAYCGRWASRRAVEGGTASIRERVELVGRLDRDALRELLAGAAMAVVPSLGGDVMPFAALEAMAAGLPVIASDSGSLPEIVGADHCVPRGDPRALAAAMAALHADPDRRRDEGEAALARARERFAESRFVEGLRALYARYGAVASDDASRSRSASTITATRSANVVDAVQPSSARALDGRPPGSPAPPVA